MAFMFSSDDLELVDVCFDMTERRIDVLSLTASFTAEKLIKSLNTVSNGWRARHCGDTHLDSQATSVLCVNLTALIQIAGNLLVIRWRKVLQDIVSGRSRSQGMLSYSTTSSSSTTEPDGVSNKALAAPRLMCSSGSSWSSGSPTFSSKGLLDYCSGVISLSATSTGEAAVFSPSPTS
jgi:hypothetical protein